MGMKGTLIGFVTGALVGSGVTYFLIGRKMNSIIDEENRKTKEYYEKKLKKTTTEKDDIIEDNSDGKDVTSEKKVSIREEIAMGTYLDVSDTYKGKTFTDNAHKIFILDEREFAIDNDYDKVGILALSDGKFKYDDGEKQVIDKIENVLGENCKKHLPDIVNSTVYFRDTEIGVDFEVMYDERSLDDIIKDE